MNDQPEVPIYSSESRRQQRPPRRTWLVWAAVFGGIVLLMLFRESIDNARDTISQHRFEQLVDANDIKHATINYGPQNIALNEIVGYYYRTGENSVRLEVPFRAQVRLTAALERKLLSRPEFEPHEPNSLLMNVIFSILPILIVAVCIWFFFIRQIRKSARSADGASDLLGRTTRQQDRFDNLLTKWEDQAARMDTVLDKMEKEHGDKS